MYTAAFARWMIRLAVGLVVVLTVVIFLSAIPNPVHLSDLQPITAQNAEHMEQLAEMRSPFLVSRIKAVTYWQDDVPFLFIDNIRGQPYLWNVVRGEFLALNATVLQRWPPGFHMIDVLMSPQGTWLGAEYGVPSWYSALDIWVEESLPVEWNMTTGESNYGGPAFNAAVSADGRFYASSNSYDSISLRDTQTDTYQRLHRSWEPDNRSMVISEPLAFSPDNTFIAAAHRDRIEVWDVATGDRVHTMFQVYPFDVQDPRYHHVIGLAFSPDGNTLVSTNTHGFVWLWNVEDGTQQGFIFDDSWIDTEEENLFNGMSSHAAFSPDGSLIAAQRGSRVLLWDFDQQILLNVLSTGGARIKDLQFNPAGTVLTFSHSGNVVRLWGVLR